MQLIYDDMEARQRENDRRLRQLDRKETSSSSGSFSFRMIVVLLLLSVTMFLKQTDMLENSGLYLTAMEQIQDQTSVSAIREKLEERVVVPTMHWLNGE